MDDFLQSVTSMFDLLSDARRERDQAREKLASCRAQGADLIKMRDWAKQRADDAEREGDWAKQRTADAECEADMAEAYIADLVTALQPLAALADESTAGLPDDAVVSLLLEHARRALEVLGPYIAKHGWSD